MAGTDEILQQIPDPGIVREHLGEALRQVRLLRRMLKLADARAKMVRITSESETREQLYHNR